MAHSDNDHTAVQEEIFICTYTVTKVIKVSQYVMILTY